MKNPVASAVANDRNFNLDQLRGGQDDGRSCSTCWAKEENEDPQKIRPAQVTSLLKEVFGAAANSPGSNQNSSRH